MDMNNDGGAGADNQQEMSLSDQMLADAEKSGFKPETPLTPGSNKAGGAAGGEADKDKDKDKNQNQNQNGNGGAADADEDAKLLEMLRKRGIEVEKLEDITRKPVAELSDEEKKKIAEEKRSKAISFGISKGLFTQAEYDESLKFQAKDQLKVVQEAFTENAKKLDPSLSDDDAEEMFNEKFFLLDDPEGTKYKLGQQELVAAYNNIKNGRFGKIDGATKVYEGYEATQSRAKNYQTQINTLFSGFPKEVEIPINGETMKVPIDPTQLETIKQDYLTTDMMNVVFDQAGKIDEKSVSEEVLKDFFWKNRDSLFGKVAVSYSDMQLTKERAGRKDAIRPDHTQEGVKEAGETNTLSDRMMSGRA